MVKRDLLWYIILVVCYNLATSFLGGDLDMDRMWLDGV